MKDPQAYLQTAAQWHFSPETGFPYWLERAKVLDFDPLTEVKTLEDPARFPDIVGELHDVAVRNRVPRGYGTNPPTPLVFETGDSTGARPVAYGARGQVLMNHISKNMFVPNNLERETAFRVPGPDGHVGDSVSEITPIQTFEGQAVLDGVY